MVKIGVSLFAFLIAISQAVVGQEVSLPASVIAKQHRVPETVIYEILMHQAAFFKDQADELDRKGGDGSPFRRHMAAKFELTDQQVLILNSIAVEYREEVKGPEKDLRDSVEHFRQQNAELPRGSKTLPPPSEAQLLIARRDAVTMRAIDRFHSRLGDVEFSRIDAIVKSRIGHDITRGPASSVGGNHEN